jgi:hypothetical protein
MFSNAWFWKSAIIYKYHLQKWKQKTTTFWGN